MMKIRILGSGTSTGVPEVGCTCPVCTSTDPRDNRLRTSALVHTDDAVILIDCGPDFREQMLRTPAFERIDGVLITHEHYDHVGGLDDLRPFCRLGEIPIHADSYTANHLFVNSEDMSFFCKLLEGSFPNYEKVIPTSFKSTCRVGKEILTAAIRRVIIMAKDKDVPNLVKFEFQEGNLILSAETNSLGSAEEKLPTIYEGEPLVISFNGNYILDALKVIDQEEILFQLQDSKSSIIIKGNDEDDTSLYICMPVRTR